MLASCMKVCRQRAGERKGNIPSNRHSKPSVISNVDDTGQPLFTGAAGCLEIFQELRVGIDHKYIAARLEALAIGFKAARELVKIWILTKGLCVDARRLCVALAAYGLSLAIGLGEYHGALAIGIGSTEQELRTNEDAWSALLRKAIARNYDGF